MKGAATKGTPRISVSVQKPLPAAGGKLWMPTGFVPAGAEALSSVNRIPHGREMPTETAATRSKYERIARFYDILDLPFEFRRYATLREQLFEGAGGRILDAGIGTGRNIAYYPPQSQVTGIDLSAAMLRRAAKRRDRLGSSVDLLEADALHTGFPSQHFDAIVASFLFCVLDETQQLPALREMRRICKPAGSIRILEYAMSERPVQRFVMRLWEPWLRWAYGAAFDRNTERYVRAAGLKIVENRFVFHDIVKLIIVKPDG